MYFQFRYAASRRTAKANLRRDAFPEPREALVEVPDDAAPRPASGRVRATSRTHGSVTYDTKRLTATGQVGRRSARRLSGLTRHGTGPDVGPLASSGRAGTRTSDRPRPSEAPTLRSHVRNSTSPRPCRCRSGATMTSMPQEASISRPPTDSRTGIVAYWPTTVVPSRASQISGPSAGTLRVAAVLPVPAQPVGFGRVGPEHAPVQRLDLAPILGAVAIDLGHGVQRSGQLPGYAAASTYSMLLMSASCVSGLSRSQRAERPPAAAAPSTSRAVLRGRRAGRRPRSARAAACTRHLLEQVVVLDDAVARVADERVLVRRLAQRPRRVPREKPERAERDRAGRRSGAAAPALAGAADARRQTTGTAPSTGSTGRRAPARGGTRAGTAARRPRAR